MENFDIEEIWKDGFDKKPELESVEEIAKKHKQKSLNIIDKIKSTSRREHRIFLVIVGIALPVLLYFKLFGWSLAVLVYAVFTITLYEYQMRIINSVIFESDTLQYLLSVKKILDKFRDNFKIAFSLITPLSYIVGMYYGISMGGKSILDVLDKTVFWVALIIGSILSVVFFRFWYKFWIKTFYGKRLQEMEDLINDLKNE